MLNLFSRSFCKIKKIERKTVNSFYTFQKNKKKGKIPKYQTEVLNVDVMTMAKVKLYLISLTGTMMRRARCCLTVDPIVLS